MLADKMMLKARVMDMCEEELRVALLSMVDGLPLKTAIDLAYHAIKEKGERYSLSASFPPNMGHR